ncbi:2-dehydro-3-deoxygalactonokinase [Sphingomonas crusticola]|uniref:2-dehydro-3-deoxygalactonokinase n=1 Tax=Sphingomonas crusticola TaxID=1697973 RepID=UPI000E21F0B4|nr:2-dehydro-3-deoxygalactonokinase [Sphingomonas crusticola]
MGGAGLVTIDWGTTNRRIFALDGAGEVISREADALGVTAVRPGGFPGMMHALRATHGDRLFLLAGMIGSNRGWIEVPYLPCPVTLADLAEQLAWVEPGRTAIVPGACVSGTGRVDVMRGEEVQMLGAAAAGLVPPDAGLCHPGTHAKWAQLKGGALVDFRTVMTGELFALLRTHSILAAQMDRPVVDGEAFRDGVQHGFFERALTADLFGTRAQILLGRLQPQDAASYVSGLLIGADVAIGLEIVPAGPVALIGDPALTRLYGAALDHIGRDYREIDGEQAFLAGIRAIAEKLA